jgi:Lecithin:cholesterol acyltransferase
VILFRSAGEAEYGVAQDLIVVVPGITGSALRRGERVLWDLSVAAVAHGLSRTAQVLQALRLPDGLGDAEPEGAYRLEPAGLIQGWHLWPGFWAGAGYGLLLHRLRRLHPDPARVVAFAFDWRLSNRVTAHFLKATVETELGRWRERTGQADAKVIYVCHSMGGLITRYYLEVLGGRDTAKQLITIGTPYSGSIKAVKALTGGLLPLLPRLNEQLVGVAATLPAVHQLLPTYHCVQTSGDPVTLTAAGLPGLPSTAAADAHGLQREIADAAHHNGPASYERYMFGGRRQPTDQSVSSTSTGLRYHRHQRGTNHAGDGTVPLFSSVAPEDDTTAAGVFYATRHSVLQRHGALLDQVIDKVSGVDLGEILAPPVELALDLPEFAVTGTDIPCSVTADVPDLLLHARVRHLNGTVLDEHIPLYPDGHGAYTTNLVLPSGTWQVDIETAATTPLVRVGDVLVVSNLTGDT